MVLQIGDRYFLFPSSCFLILMLMIIFTLAFEESVTAEACPASCNCTQVKEKVQVSCLTYQPQQVIPALPLRTTHLLLILKYEEYGMAMNVTFEDLKFLEVLILDQEKSANMKELKFHSKTFVGNPRLTVIKSHVGLYLKEETFLPLSALTVLSLSNTRMDWKFLPKLVQKSLRNKKHLHTLCLSQFYSGWTNSHFLGFFKPEEVLGSMKSSPLINLDLSGNYINRFDLPNLCKIFPLLQTFNISFNSMNLNSRILSDRKNALEIVLFPLLCKYIKAFDLGQQGRPVLRPEMYSVSDLDEYTGNVNGDGINSDTDRKILQSKTPKPSILSDNIWPENTYQTQWKIPLNALERLICTNTKQNRNVWLAHKGYLRISFFKNVLQYMDLSKNNEWDIEFISQRVTFDGLNKLKYLNLQANNFKIFNESWFSSFKALQVLLLSGNLLGPHISDGTGTLNLCDNHQLQTLDLAANLITEMPSNIFSCLKTLHFLNLSTNSIQKLDLDLDNLHCLQSLNLSSNKLSTISKKMQDTLDSIAKNLHPENNNSTFFEIDLTNNPLACGCDNLEFISWFQTSEVNFHNKKLYKCGHPFKGFVTMYNISIGELKMQCFPSKVKIIVLSVAFSMLTFVFVILLVTLYCKRWHLRYWWYITKKGWKKLLDHSDNTHYEYDAFVAYNYKDSAWVHHSLIQEMETKRGMKLCIHHRDFPGGEVLEEVITDKIEKSRKTILVLSPNFVHSNWCHFELQMARSRLFGKGQDVLVLVILKPLPLGSVTITLFQLLKKKVYLEWTDDTQGHELFWNKLYDGLANEKDCRPFD